MPHIATAMRGSVQARGVAPYAVRRLVERASITDTASSVKDTFSSWDKCMQKTYCKWPVIVAIIVASLIVLSVVWCIVRCACCGMSCCCSCFSFLKCCDCCGGCCDGKKNRPHKHLDDNGYYPPQQGYKAPDPMMGGGLGGNSYDQPRFAQFDVGKNGLAVEPKSLSEDALPPMPSWETASKRKVLAEEEKDAVELGELDPVTGQRVPLMAGAAGAGISAPPSPGHDMAAGPYGARPGMGGGGYRGVEDTNQMGRGYGGIPSSGPMIGGGLGYRGSPSPGPGMGGSQGGYRGSPSPGPGMGGNQGGYRGSPSPGPGMGARGYGPDMDNYGPPSPRGASPGPNNGFADAAVGGYGRSRDQYSPRPMNSGRQYSDASYQDPYQQNRGPQGPSRGLGRTPPLTNAAGFDFGIGSHEPQYSSRPSPPPQHPSYGSPSPVPQQRGGGGGYFTGNTSPPSYASRSPQPQHPEPTYQPYVPPSEPVRSATPQALVPGGERGREPQNWDPVQR